MLDDLRKRKIRREFDFFDTNKDGLLAWDDFERAAQNLAGSMGWAPGSEEHAGLMKARRTTWEEICLAADFDESDKIDIEEYTEFYARMTADMGTTPADAKPWFRRVCAAHIESMDLEGLGHIEPAGYARFIKAHNQDFDAAACFERLDLDGNGVLDMDEAVELSLQFYLSDQPDQPGNWIWGPLDA